MHHGWQEEFIDIINEYRSIKNVKFIDANFQNDSYFSLQIDCDINKLKSEEIMKKIAAEINDSLYVRLSNLAHKRYINLIISINNNIGE